VVYQTNGTTPRLGVGLMASADMLSPDAQKILHDADAVLVTVGFDASTESEGFDRTYAMPWPQNELIQQVTALNPKTIVSITAGAGADPVRRLLAGRPSAFQLGAHPGPGSSQRPLRGRTRRQPYRSL